ncbi:MULTISPECIES: restriction endonuclease subunit S [unclassified Thioalkalivibrio]|uniref:restriction endonuclease subunit S n=1 Tax=unclassified Thioalkalivibrio TaxID=2621013 RepID=UPI00036BD9A6|nr:MULTISPECIES: restriction endonuclease subunit S [unclassified Thioalkalivibrio]
MSFPKYPEYKDSGVEWLGVVPENWGVCRARNLGRFSASGIDKKTVEGEHSVQMFNYLDVYRSQGKVLSGGNELMETTAPPSKVIEHSVKAGDILLTPSSETADDVGHAAVVGQTERATVYSYHLIRFRASIPCEPRYLCHWFNSQNARSYFSSVATGTTRMVLSRGDFKDAPVPLPDLSEQKKISAFLDHEIGKIDALIEEQRRLIELLKEKRQAVISHAVTDHGCKTPGRLGYYIDLLPGYAFPSQGFRFDDGIRLLRGINVGVGEIRWNEAVFWPEESTTGLEDYFLREGDVVLGMDRPWIGGGTRVARVSRQDLPALLLQRVARIRAIEGLDPGFLWLILVSQEFKRELETDLTGVSVPHISPEQIRSFRISLPDIEVQSELGKRVELELEKVGLLIEQCERSIALMEERKTSLVSAAVTGKVDVGGWSTGAKAEEAELAMVAEESAGYSAQGGAE